TTPRTTRRSSGRRSGGFSRSRSPPPESARTRPKRASQPATRPRFNRVVRTQGSGTGVTDAQLASLTVQLRTFLAAVQRETNVPGIGVAVSVGGRRAFAQVGTLLAGDRAPLAIDARFQLGCITKLLLA